MSPKKVKKQEKDSVDIHLCWDCVKAGITGSCHIYEGITSIIDENFDDVKILFNVPECAHFEDDSGSY